MPRIERTSSRPDVDLSEDREPPRGDDLDPPRGTGTHN